MKTSPSAPALLVALLAAPLAGGCASSAWEKTESVPGGRLYVPKVWAPLLPGSIYPDKKVAVPARGRPGIVVVCPDTGDCRKDEILDRAAQRGLVVLLLARSASAPQKDDVLRTRVEADPKRIGWLLVSPTGDFLRRWTDAGAPGEAVAILAPARDVSSEAAACRHPAASPSSPSRKILLATLLDRDPLEADDGTVLKLYSPSKENLLPGQAYRDAVEWLAGELGAR